MAVWILVVQAEFAGGFDIILGNGAAMHGNSIELQHLAPLLAEKPEALLVMLASGDGSEPSGLGPEVLPSDVEESEPHAMLVEAARIGGGDGQTLWLRCFQRRR
jgi:hypothetical protein